jgi:hypothetical protein
VVKVVFHLLLHLQAVPMRSICTACFTGADTGAAAAAGSSSRGRQHQQQHWRKFAQVSTEKQQHSNSMEF